MSLDSLSHVIVGGGHFIERAGSLVQVVNTVPLMVERSTQVLVGIDRSSRSIINAQAAFDRNRAMTMEKIPAGFIMPKGLESKFELIKNHADKAAKAAAEHERHAENLNKLYEAGKDLGLALGYGAAGDVQGAAEAAADAAWKSGEVFWDNFKHGFGN